jgi:glycosyltransferase involved in cell wall biosynthesis
MKLSVVICAHNPREEFLRRTLSGLQNQTLSFHEWELLLVDNGSTVSLAGRFDLTWHPGARHVREDELGLTPARLRGIKESAADILVFVDDDTVLAPDYLEQALRIGSEWPFVGVWGGSVIPEFAKPLPAWVGNQIWRLTVVDVKADIWGNLREGFTTIPVGAGMCVRKNVCRRFMDRCQANTDCLALGRKGAGLGGYEDAEIAQCAIDLGLGTGKSTRLRLTHLIPDGRLTLDYFVRHSEGDAISMMLFRASRGLPIQPPKPATLIGSIRWFIHRLIHRVPREQYEIAKAHQRGLVKGYQLARKYLAESNRPDSQ